jgi:DNA-binding protein H-NS
MARPSKLTSMSVEALIKLRDDISTVLSRKANQLQSQLAALGDGGWISSGKRAVGRPRGSKMKGRKVAPKYRNPKDRSETWAGRGAMPRWMAAQIKAGKKREDFAIDKSIAKTKKGAAKKIRGKRKAGAASRKITSKSAPASATSEAAS